MLMLMLSCIDRVYKIELKIYNVYIYIYVCKRTSMYNVNASLSEDILYFKTGNTIKSIEDLLKCLKTTEKIAVLRFLVMAMCQSD